jgi:hypothetical protein
MLRIKKLRMVGLVGLGISFPSLAAETGRGLFLKFASHVRVLLVSQVIEYQLVDPSLT